MIDLNHDEWTELETSLLHANGLSAALHDLCSNLQLHDTRTKEGLEALSLHLMQQVSKAHEIFNKGGIKHCGKWGDDHKIMDKIAKT